MDSVLIVITCFNHENYVEKTIRSAINQTYKNTAIVVIDNNSCDNSKAIIQKMVLEFSFLKTIFHVSNIGICKAVNDVSLESSATYLIDLSADDLLHPNFIERSVEQFKRLDNEHAVVCSRAYEIDVDDIITGKFSIYENKNGYVFEDFLNRKTSSLIGHLIKLSAFKNLNGYDESLHFEDFDFHARCSRIYKYHFFDEFLFGYRFLPNSLSKSYHQKSKMIDSYFISLTNLLKTSLNESEKQIISQVAIRNAYNAFFLEKFKKTDKFLLIAGQNGLNTWPTKLLKLLNRLRIRNYGLVFQVWRFRFRFKQKIYTFKYGSRNFNDLPK